MRLGRTGLVVGAVAVVFLVLFLDVPLVRYSASVSIPRNYASDAYSACQPVAGNASEYDSCLNGHLLPPAVINGSASAAYSLLGYGPGPYPTATLVAQGHQSALVYWRGSTISMAELLPFGRDIGPDNSEPPLMLPEGSLSLSDVGFTPASNGLLEFSATVSGLPVSGHTCSYCYQPGAAVYFDYPGYGTNTTFERVVWHSPLADIGCGGSGGSCVASREVASNPDLQANVTYPMIVVVYGFEVVGLVNSTMSYNGATSVFQQSKLRPYVYVQELGVKYPGSGVTPAWVQAFIGVVNRARGTSPLVEDPGLDAFAMTRFATASSNYQISDYGFDNQSAQFFAGTGRTSNEEILYPSTYSPSDLAAALQKDAPGHWAELLSGAYTKLGYYIGTAPSVEFSLSCPVNEITQRNVNITQIAVQNGCQYEVETVAWLLLVLSN